MWKNSGKQIHRGAVRKNTWMPDPRGTVALLHRSVPQVGIDPWASASLIEMLRILREVEATIPQAPRFVELEGRAAKWELAVRTAGCGAFRRER